MFHKQPEFLKLSLNLRQCDERSLHKQIGFQKQLSFSGFTSVQNSKATNSAAYLSVFTRRLPECEERSSQAKSNKQIGFQNQLNYCRFSKQPEFLKLQTLQFFFQSLRGVCANMKRDTFSKLQRANRVSESAQLFSYYKQPESLFFVGAGAR